MRNAIRFWAVCFLAMGILFIAGISAREFQAHKVTDNVFVISGIEGGEGQIVITSDSGLVVLNSYRQFCVVVSYSACS